MHIHIHIYIYTHTYLSIYVYIHMYTHIYVYVYIQIYIYMYMYIHTSLSSYQSYLEVALGSLMLNLYWDDRARAHGAIRLENRSDPYSSLSKSMGFLAWASNLESLHTEYIPYTKNIKAHTLNLRTVEALGVRGPRRLLLYPAWMIS